MFTLDPQSRAWNELVAPHSTSSVLAKKFWDNKSEGDFANTLHRHQLPEFS